MKMPIRIISRNLSARPQGFLRCLRFLCRLRFLRGLRPAGAPGAIGSQRCLGVGMSGRPGLRALFLAAQPVPFPAKLLPDLLALLPAFPAHILAFQARPVAGLGMLLVPRFRQPGIPVFTHPVPAVMSMTVIMIIVVTAGNVRLGLPLPDLAAVTVMAPPLRRIGLPGGKGHIPLLRWCAGTGG